MKPIVTTLAVLLAVAPTVALAQAITVDQKPLYESQAAYYAAVEAKAKAQAATSAALTGAIPAAPATGAVTVHDGAGAAEANILVAQAIIDAAGKISAAVSSSEAKGKEVVIFPGSEAPDLSQWQAFKARREAIQAQLRFAASEKASAPAAGAPRPIALAALDAVAVVVKLAELTFTDRELGTVPVSATDYELAAALAAQIKPSILGPLRFGFKSASLEGELNSLDADARKVKDRLNQVLRWADERSMATPAERQTYAEVALDLATALNGYNTFRQLLDLPPLPVPVAVTRKSPSLSKASEKAIEGASPLPDGGQTNADPKKGETKKDDPKAHAKADAPDKPAAAVADTLSLVAVLRQKAIADAIAGGYGLFVKTHAAASSYLTRKGLFASLSPMPIKVSGSVVASYALIDGATDAVAAAGLVGKLHPLQRLDKVSCNVPATSPLCPAKP